jgi:hypothetical protein
MKTLKACFISVLLIIFCVTLVTLLVVLLKQQKVNRASRLKQIVPLRYVSSVIFNGLGNQLFQIAAAFGYATYTGRKLVIHTPSIKSTVTTHTAEKYTDTIFKSWKQVNVYVDESYVEGDAFSYKPIPKCDVKHFQLNGHFQDERHFKHCFPEFKKFLHLPTDLPVLSNTCFIHLRLGDYLHTPGFNIELTKYYLPRAMQLQRKANPQVQFLVFSNDMERSKALLASCDVTFSTETNEVRTLVAMSRCWLGGICANSTFSWWGAYLNPNPARVVTFPSKWINADREVDIQFEGSHILSVKKE